MLLRFILAKELGGIANELYFSLLALLFAQGLSVFAQHDDALHAGGPHDPNNREALSDLPEAGRRPVAQSRTPLFLKRRVCRAIGGRKNSSHAQMIYNI